MGMISATNSGALQFLDTDLIVRQYNTFFGLQGFYIKNEAFFSYKGTFTTNTSISITSNNFFFNFNFVYIIFE